MNIQLSIEEALDYQKFEADLAGFQAGVAVTLDFVRRRKIAELMKARVPAVPDTSAANTGEN